MRSSYSSSFLWLRWELCNVTANEHRQRVRKRRPCRCDTWHINLRVCRAFSGRLCCSGWRSRYVRRMGTREMKSRLNGKCYVPIIRITRSIIPQTWIGASNAYARSLLPAFISTILSRNFNLGIGNPESWLAIEENIVTWNYGVVLASQTILPVSRRSSHIFTNGGNRKDVRNSRILSESIL